MRVETVVEQFKVDAIELARQDSPEGFAAFYALITDRALPPYGLRWTRKMYEARENDKALVVEAFRGSSKTTTFSVVFVAHRIGLDPHKTNLIIRAKDPPAKKSAAAVARIIEKNPWWKLIFPHVRPDIDRGWAQNGYWVRDSRVDEGRWSILTSSPDPTLMGTSITSEDALGMHPSGVLILDDIHTEKNTRSEREFKEIMDRLTGTIFPTLEPGAFNVLIGTPWREDDAIGYAKEIPLRFETIREPLFEKDNWADFSSMVTLHNPTEEELTNPELPTSIWPERFTAHEVMKRYQDQKRGGAIKFAQMFLLDLEAAKGKTLKREWLRYTDEINENWPIYIGVDYATAEGDLRVGQRRDYFAAAIVRQNPAGRCFVVGGVRMHLSQGQAEQKLKLMSLAYPELISIGIETDGKGEEFYNLMTRHSDLPLFPTGTKSKAKAYRFEKIMAPAFEFNRVSLANHDDEFLNAFENEWLSWPDGRYDDTLDAVFYALVAAGMFLEDFAPSPVRGRRGAWFSNRTKQKSPFASFGR